MKAMVIEEFGAPDNLRIRELALPEPAAGEVRIRIRAFGLNRAETYMRRGLWAESHPVSGIECVGEVDLDPSGKLHQGQKVAAIMGGLGRTRPGSYAEYTCASTKNIFTLETSLPWEELAAIPEAYATSWVALHENLRITNGSRLLVRGATSSVGQAAVNMAVAAGLTVLATTRRESRIETLKDLGARSVFLESDTLHKQVRELYPEGVDCVLDLIGNSVLLDSMKVPKKGGKVCQAGFLGGADPITINPIADFPSGVDFNFVGSFYFGTSDYPLSAIPMQRIVDLVAGGEYKAKPAAVFPFDRLSEAHRLMESNEANGKIVVSMNGKGG
jgi:NADPH2:quinone reductase